MECEPGNTSSESSGVRNRCYPVLREGGGINEYVPESERRGFHKNTPQQLLSSLMVLSRNRMAFYD